MDALLIVPRHVVVTVRMVVKIHVTILVRVAAKAHVRPTAEKIALILAAVLAIELVI